MTMAFDTINREHLYKLLSNFLDPDGLDIMNILLNDVTLQVINNGARGQILQQLLEFLNETVSVEFFLHCTFQLLCQRNTNSYT